MISSIDWLAIPDMCLIRTKRHADSRGWFMETYKSQEIAEHGIGVGFVQDNTAMSKRRGTVRGLHFQAPPSAQAKLIRVARGAIFDVAVDLRVNSETYGQWLGVELNAESGDQLFVPRGFAHGYCTLQDDTEVSYKCDSFYDPGAEGGIAFDDLTLAIAWPITMAEIVCSDRDRGLQTFDRFVSPFTSEVEYAAKHAVLGDGRCWVHRVDRGSEIEYGHAVP